MIANQTQAIATPYRGNGLLLALTLAFSYMGKGFIFY
jgi:hypothetical protein